MKYKTWRTPWGETVKVSLEAVKRAAARFLRAAEVKDGVVAELDRGYLSPHQREVRLPVWARVLAFSLGLVYDPRDRSGIARAFARAKAEAKRVGALEAAGRSFWAKYRKAREAHQQAENAAKAKSAKARAYRARMLAEAKEFALEAEAAYAEALGLEAKWYGVLPPEAAPTAVLWAWRELKRRALARVLRPRPWEGGLLWPRPEPRRLLAEGLALLAREGASELAPKAPEASWRPEPLRLLAEDLLQRYREEGDKDAVIYMAAVGSVLGLPGDPGELAQVAIVGAWKALQRWKPGGIPREVWGMVHGRRAAQVFLSKRPGFSKRDAEVLRKAMYLGAEEGRALLEAHGLLVEIEGLVNSETGEAIDLEAEGAEPGEIAWQKEVRERLLQTLGGEERLELLLRVFVDGQEPEALAQELGVDPKALAAGVEALADQVRNDPHLRALWAEA